MNSAVRPMSRNHDPRAVRARSALVAAFEEAVATRSPGEVTVSGLCRAAGVNRSTFYQHFASPQDIALHSLGELFDLIRDADIVLRSSGSKVSAADASRAAIGGLVTFIAARRTLYARLLGPGAPPAVGAAISKAFVEHSVQALTRMSGRPADADPVVVAHFLAGGVLGAIAQWLGDDDHVGSGDARTAEVLVDDLLRCLPAWLVDDGTTAPPPTSPPPDGRSKE